MTAVLRVLVVEDNPADAALIRETLLDPQIGGFEIECVSRLSAAVERLGRGSIDLVLLDLGLPDSQGPASLQTLQQAAPEVPLIVLTGNDDQDLAVAAVRDGAQDFLIKGQANGDVLARAARYAVERKREEERERLARGILELLNRPNGSADVIRDILLLIKQRTGLEAVGIRLREGDDYPYYATNGLADSFVQAERFLCERDAAGNLVRGNDGNPVLECMCGNVICGRTDPTKPFFTANGSFWTNNTTKLLATTTEQDRQSRTRNRCNAEGYESVALIPLRSGTETIGLLQLNDHRPDRFRRGVIRFFEGLGASIGIALSRKRSEDALRSAKAFLADVIDKIADPVFVKDDQRRFVLANDALCTMVGRSREELLGKDGDDWFPADQVAVFREMDARVLNTGEENLNEESLSNLATGEVRRIVTRKTRYTDPAGKTFLVGVIRDITERKRAEELQRGTLSKLRATFDGVIKTIMRAVEIRDPYTAGHQRRVADLALAIAVELGLSEEQRDAILFAGNIHDIGKIAVPAEILSKPGKLSAIEFGLIKEHSRTAYEMLLPVTFPWPLPEIVLQHHERLDGSGYPEGLAGAAIRPEAQIIAVADVVEAMASHRPYRAALGIDVALAEIARQRGKQLDGPAVDACIHLFRDKAYQFPA